MGQNPKCLGYNKGKNQGDKFKYIVDVYSLSPPPAVLANIHSMLAYDVPRTEDVGLPIKFRLNVGPVPQPIAGSMPVNRLQRWPNTNQWICCKLCPNTWFSPNAVSMLTHSPRRWPVIETASGDCTVFSESCIMWVTLPIPALETPDNTIH